MKDVFQQYRGLSRELYILALARAIASAGAFVVPMMALILTEKLGLSAAQSGMIVTVASASYIPGSLIGGKLADSFGRKRILVIAEFTAGVCWFVCGFAPESLWIIPFIFIANFCWGAIDPTTNALITDITAPEKRKAAFSLGYLGHNLGFAIGPLIAGLLFVNHAHWMFWGDGLTTGIAVLLVMWLVNESKPDPSKKAHSELEETKEGSVWPILMQRRHLLWFTAANFLLAFSYGQLMFTLPLHLEQLFENEGARFYGILMTVNAITVLVFTPITVALTKRTHPIFAVAFTGLLFSVGMGMNYWIETLWLFFISTFVWTVGETMHHINANAYIASHSPQSHRGRINSILPIIYGTGFGIAPMLAGQFIDSRPIEDMWLLVLMLSMFGAIWMVVLGKKDLNRTSAVASSS